MDSNGTKRNETRTIVNEINNIRHVQFGLERAHTRIRIVNIARAMYCVPHNKHTLKCTKMYYADERVRTNELAFTFVNTTRKQ